jgi:hypothetical protein
VIVGVTVSVFRGVGVVVAVGVDEGKTAAVREAAAFAVWAINVLTSFGFAVGRGAARDGTQAMTSAMMASQNTNFRVRVDMFPLPHRKTSESKSSVIFPL